MENENTEKKELVFPEILPSSIVESSFRIFETDDFKIKEDIDELIRLLFEEPECSFYYFRENDKGYGNSLLLEEKRKGNLLMNKTDFFYYRHPKHKHHFIKIKVRDGKFQSDWQRAVVEKGPMFIRTKTELSQKKRTELELLQKISIEEKHRKQGETNNNDNKANTSKTTITDIITHLFFQFLWPVNTWKKKVRLFLVIITIGTIFLWYYVPPDQVKVDILRFLWKKAINNEGQHPNPIVNGSGEIPRKSGEEITPYPQGKLIKNPDGSYSQKSNY